MSHAEYPPALRPQEEFIPFPHSDLEQTIPARFAKIAAAYPERLALKAGEQALTYAELDARANRVAHALLATLGGGAEPIVLLCDHGVPFVIALLGVLKVGKFYVILEPTLPSASVAAVIAETDARLLFADAANLATARCHESEIRVAIAETFGSGQPSHAPEITTLPGDLACICFTTGSTGKPKGTMLAHRNVLYNTLNYTNTMYFNRADRIALLNAISSIVTIGDLFAALLNGGSAFLFSIRKEGLHRLAAWLAEEEITVFLAVPTIFRQLAAALTGTELYPKLRIIRMGGDRVLRSDFDLYKRHYSANTVFKNGYGATELLQISHYFMDKHSFLDERSPAASRVIPAGYALEDSEVLIVDDFHQPLGFDQTGEVAIKSRYLPPGYWREPALTAARFLELPGSDERIFLTGDLGRMQPDGCLIHLGRKDFQVKIRGKLIAPIEVENALLDIPGIVDAVVIAVDDELDSSRLIAYYVADQPPGPNVSAIRRALAARLTSEMIPASFVALDTMPLNARSKIDRKALPAPSQARPRLETPFVAPITPFEQELALIWSEVLRIDNIGVDDNFLELGGDSLLASQVVSRVVERLVAEIPAQTLLEAPTVATMATKIVIHMAQTNGGAELL